MTLLVAAAAAAALIVSAETPALANSAPAATAPADAVVTSVSCSSAGNCAAGGRYFDASGHTHAFVLTERNGRWGRAIEVPGLAALKPPNAGITSVSCAPAGGCAAGGYYRDASSRYHAFVTTKQNGMWSRRTVLSARKGSPAITRVRSVSCPAPGSCVAGGRQPPFRVSEVRGRWRRAIHVPGKDKNAGVVVSCASTGNCVAAWDSLVSSERNGRWGKTAPVPGLAALGTDAVITSVSCTAPGSCAAAGDYRRARGGQEVFVASERSGRWAKAIAVPGFAALNEEGDGDLTAVSCISAGNCVAGGDYAAPADFAGGVYVAFVAVERNGRWGKAIDVPGIPPPSSAICEPDSSACVAGQVFAVSCARAGHCAVGGWYDTPQIAGEVAFVASYTNGRWHKVMQIPGLASLDTGKHSKISSVSCTASGSCAAAGNYLTTGAQPGFVADETNGIWGQAQTVRF